MAGAVNSGKTLYIACMEAELRRYLAKTFKTKLTPLGTTEATLAAHYLGPIQGLDKDGSPSGPPRKPGTTPAQHTDDAYQKESLIWSLGHIGGRERYLAFRDVAGEDLERRPFEPTSVPFFALADAVFFLVDPQSIPGIEGQLPPGSRDQVGAGSELVWTNLSRTLPQVGTPPSTRPDVGVVISKFDLLQGLKDGTHRYYSSIMSNASAAFYQDQPLRARPHLDDGGKLVRGDLDDAERLSLEVESLLSLAGGEEKGFLTAVAPARPRFFAVSSLGEPVRGDDLSPRGICRFRVLDPLIWVFNNRWFR
jgi:hypothetical protein